MKPAAKPSQPPKPPDSAKTAQQSGLFDGLPGLASPSLTQALTVMSTDGQSLSKEQLDFNKQLKRVQKLRDDIDALEQVANAERATHAAQLAPVHAEAVALRRAICMSVHDRLARKGLTKNQREDAEAVVVALATDPAFDDDDEIQELIKIYREESEWDDRGYDAHEFDEPSADEIKMMREQMTATTGISLADLPDNASADEVLAAFQERLHAAKAQSEATREAEKLERKGKRTANRKLNPKQLERQAAEKLLEEAKQTEAKNAEAALRTVYRQLASELHPDRETDPEHRERKSALMSEVNAAYDKRDLLALLGLQLKIAQTNPDKLQAFATGRLAALKSLLSDQFKDLSRQKTVLAARLQHEFELDWFSVVEASTLPALLLRQRRASISTNQMLTECLSNLSDDRWFKGWVKDEARQIRNLFDQSVSFGSPFG